MERDDGGPRVLAAPVDGNAPLASVQHIPLVADDAVARQKSARQERTTGQLLGRPGGSGGDGGVPSGRGGGQTVNYLHVTGVRMRLG